MGRRAQPPKRHWVLIGILAAGAVCVLLLFGLASGGEGAPAPGREEAQASTTLGPQVTPVPQTTPAPQVAPAPPLSTAPASSATTASTGVPSTSAPGPDVACEEVDILLYGTQTSALGVLRAFLLSQERYLQDLTLAVVSPATGLESPLVQGLSVEDEFFPEHVSGFYGEFRQAVLDEYQSQGIDPCLEGRLTYEPTVAAQVLLQLSGLAGLVAGERRTLGARTVAYYQGSLVSASDDDIPRVEVELAGGSRHCFRCRYLIDASVEADLARMVGCDYRLGTSPLLYNDAIGRRPEPPTSRNRYMTAPQSLSLLLTLGLDAAGWAPPEREPHLSLESEETPLLGPHIWTGFGQSWSMKHLLPHDKRELNETWSDYPDAVASYEWFLFPERRSEILEALTRFTLARVEELRAHGYPELRVAHLPTYPYVRGEVMVVGEYTYCIDDLEAEVARDPVAVGGYALYDRHDSVEGSFQIPTLAVARLPLGATTPRGHPHLAVSTAFSTDWRTYSSAVRMENLRANAGAAVGTLVVAAAATRSGVGEVPYAEVLAELEHQGHELW